LAAVFEKYGEPSNRYRDTGYMQWFYDLVGQKIDLATSPSNSCRRTLEFRLEKDPQGRVHGMNRSTNDNLNFWGCSLVMELTGNPSGGGVTTYLVRAYSGYVMAIDHFHQQIMLTEEFKKKIEVLQERKPRF